MQLIDTSSISGTSTIVGPGSITLDPNICDVSASAGTLVGVLSTNLDVSVTWFCANTNFTCSPSVGITTNLLRSSSGILVAGTTETASITATRFGATPRTEVESIIVPAADVFFTFELENWSSNTTSSGFYRGCFLFVDGDMPVGSIPLISRAGTSSVTCQYDEYSTWTASGALALCVFSIRDTTFSASESRLYSMTAVPGTFDNTGTKTINTITASENYTITILGCTQSATSSTTIHGSGSMSAAFNTHAIVPTRVTKYASGRVREGYEVWGMYLDGATPDPHAKTYWYVDIWKDATDAVVDFEHGVVTSLDWWSVPDKYRLNYTASYKAGATTLQTRTGIAHPYRSQWITVQSSADNSASKRFWKNSMPTLFYKPNKDYWVQTGLMPPLDTTFIPNPSASIPSGNAGPYTTPYTPCSNVNHRAFVDGTGAYMGRGMVPNTDAIAFMRQTADDTRYARNNALAGLSIPFHYRSNRTRTRPGDATADTASTVISLILDPQSASAYTFTSLGMPTPVNAYIGGGTPEKDGYVAPLGGTGVWILGIDASHAVNYSGFMYLLEGERYLMQATLDLACNLEQQTNGNVFAGRVPLEYYDYTAYQVAFSIPSTPWGGVGQMRTGSQTRRVGFALNLKGWASALVPDSDPQANYIRASLNQNLRYGALSMNYMPNSQTASAGAGWWRDYNVSNFPVGSTYNTSWAPWMHHIVSLGALQAYRMTKNPDALTIANMTTNVAIGAFDNLPYLSITYHGQATPKSLAWDAATNDFFARGQWLYGPFSCLANTASNTLTLVSSSTGLWWNFNVTNDDVFYVTTMNDNAVPVVPPSELTVGSPYYAVNKSGPYTFQISSASAGAAIDLLTPGTYYLAGRLADMNRTVATNPPVLPQADDYSPMCRAVIIDAANVGNVSASALVATADTFLQNVSSINWVTWKYGVI